MMKRNSSLSVSSDGKRHSRWGRHHGRAQGGAEYSLVPSSEDGDHVPLSNFREELCLEKELQPGDTLRSLALEFNCSTAELKRVNRILKDNEIFALRVVKIPAQCYSLLTERLASVHTSACSSEGSREAPPAEPHAPVAPPRDLQAAGDAASLVGLLDGDAEEDGVQPTHQTNVAGTNASYSGADWGLSWITLLIFALILGIVGSLLYVLYTTYPGLKKKT